MAKHLIRKSQHAAIVGIAFIAAGAFLMHDAFEGRGKDRPLWARFFGSWG